jgi:excisionase family DNA binding protein
MCTEGKRWRFSDAETRVIGLMESISEGDMHDHDANTLGQGSPKIPENERLTMKVADAARLLGLSSGSTYRAAHAGYIPSLRIGGRVLVLREPLMRMLSGGDQIGTAA